MRTEDNPKSPQEFADTQTGTPRTTARAPDLVARATRREQVQRIAYYFGKYFAVFCAISLAWVLLWRRGWFDDRVFYYALCTGLFMSIGMGLWRARRKASPIKIAARLDKASGRPDDSLRSSYEFEQTPTAARTRYQDLHLQRFPQFSTSVVRQAYPWSFKPWYLVIPLLGGLCILAAQWSPGEIPGFTEWQQPARPTEPSFVSASTLFEREQLAQLSDEMEYAGNKKLQRIFEELRQLLQDLEAGLDNEEALERLKELATSIEPTENLDVNLRPHLQHAASPLSSTQSGKELAQALEEGDLKRAAKALERLTTKELSDRQAQQLSRALRESSESLTPLPQEAKRKLRNMERELKRLNRDPQTSNEERNRAREKLEQLERQRQQKASKQSGTAGQQERVSRALRRKARQVEQASSESQANEATPRSSPSNSSNTMREAARRQSEARARRALRDRAESIRQSIQRGSQSRSRRGSGETQAQRMREYLRRAGADMDRLRSGQSGGQRGQSPSQQRRLQQLSRQRSTNSGQAQGPTQGQSSQSGNTASQTGKGEGFGTTHKDDEYVQPTTRGTGGEERQIHDTPEGEGPSTEQIIMGGEDGGFSGVPYREVYQDYQTIRESVMDDEKIPSGYRYYIRKYFDLISPRTP